MKWIVLAIAVFVVGYSLVNFYFRKPGPAYRPYQDSQDRATLARLVASGWRKVPVEFRRPTERPPTENLAQMSRGAPGLGVDFEANFAEKPRLVATVNNAAAPASVPAGFNYQGYFIASIADLKTEVGEISVYFKDKEVVLVPTLETLPGEVLSRREDSIYAFSFPTDVLPAGTYQVRLVADGPAILWSFTVL